MVNVLTVSTTEELYKALGSIGDGGTILLSGGDYGDVEIRSSDKAIQLPTGVTIKSADVTDPAVFTGAMITGTENFTFDGLVFDYRFEAGDEAWENSFGFFDNTDLTVRNSVFDGDLASGVSAEEDGFGFGLGVTVRGGDGFVFENNEMFDFWKGIKIFESSDVVLSGNDIHSMRMDGINFAEVNGLLIEDNHIHDFQRTTLHWDHADMIQGWTAGTDAPSSDIVIRGNLLDIGEGDYTHSIFMGNNLVETGQAGEEMYFRNVTIEDNLIVNGHSHGIALGASIGVVIDGNTVVHSDGSKPDGIDSAVEIPRIQVAALSQDVTITGNITADILVSPEGPTGSNWTVAENLLVQDQNPTEPNHYSTVFVASSIDSRTFVPLPDGEASGLGAVAGGGGDAQFHAAVDPTNLAAFSFDASIANDGFPDGTTYEWDFADGTTASGPQARHVFSGPGSYEVILTVTTPGGDVMTARHDLMLRDSVLFDYAAGSGMAMSMAEFEPKIVDGPDGLVLGAADGPALSISRIALADMLSAESFSVSLGMTLAKGGSGTLFRFGRDINATIGQTGDLIVSVGSTGSDLPITLKTNGAKLNTGTAHDLELKLSEGKLTLWIDGTSVASADMKGSLTNGTSHDFWLGTAWGASVPGVVDKLSIAANEHFLKFAQPGQPLDAEPPVAVEEPKVEPEVEDGGTVDDTVAESLPVASTDDASDLQAPEPVLADPVDSGSGTEEDAGSEAFNITLTVKSNKTDSSGHLVSFSNEIWADQASDGNLRVFVRTENDGVLEYRTEGLDIRNGKPHEVALQYRDRDLSLSVDGKEVMDVTLPSDIQNVSSGELKVGNVWTSKAFKDWFELFMADAGETIDPDDNIFTDVVLTEDVQMTL